MDHLERGGDVLGLAVAVRREAGLVQTRHRSSLSREAVRSVRGHIVVRSNLVAARVDIPRQRVEVDRTLGRAAQQPVDVARDEPALIEHEQRRRLPARRAERLSGPHKRRRRELVGGPSELVRLEHEHAFVAELGDQSLAVLAAFGRLSVFANGGMRLDESVVVDVQLGADGRPVSGVADSAERRHPARERSQVANTNTTLAVTTRHHHKIIVDDEIQL